MSFCLKIWVWRGHSVKTTMLSIIMIMMMMMMMMKMRSCNMKNHSGNNRNATNVTMHAMILWWNIWKDIVEQTATMWLFLLWGMHFEISYIWKCIAKKNQTNAASVSMHPIGQVLWGSTWKYTVTKGHTNAPNVAMPPVLRIHLRSRRIKEVQAMHYGDDVMPLILSASKYFR